ncbi:ferredoxin [Saccharothrix sp. Mg75]|uniref:ferredoxin n=1 Tax=Saccharothrix sp. Mg75 TaxID=3445357 RepID=UPI003EE8E0B1
MSVDRAVCGGVGLCESMHPALFRLDADGVAEARKTELGDPDEIAAARAVRDCCPTEAVLLRGTGERHATSPD